MPALEIEGLVKRFGSVEALRGVSFTVGAGEVFGYLGPNGSGKTTTLRVILGLVRPDSGEARLLGEASRAARARRRVGFLPGELALPAEMTGRALLDYFARFRPERPPVLRERLAEALGVSSDTLARRVKLLSHGTRQKLGLLVAMQHDPELLLLDEPTLGLDPLVQQAFRAAVRDFAARGRAVLFSSHILSEVEAVCDRVAILRAGEVVALETIEALRRQMVRRLRVRFRGRAPEDLAATPGVAEVRREDGDTVIAIRGDVNPVLRRIAREEVEQFVFPEPELEDVFLSYYRPAGPDG